MARLDPLRPPSLDVRVRGRDASWPGWRTDPPPARVIRGDLRAAARNGPGSWWLRFCDPESFTAQFARDLNNLASILHDLGELAAARPLAERALAIYEAIYAPDNPVVASILRNLALMLRDLGESAAARPLAERALAIIETTHGPDHPTAKAIRAEWGEGEG